MQQKPLVSIVTVCYNSVQTIEQTIRSVLQQTYKHIEYIIIDGGSTDGTLDVIRHFADQISSSDKGIYIRWLTGKDDGIYDAMNKGLRMAMGDIIGIINSDDWYEVYAVECIVDTMLRHKACGVCHGGIRTYDKYDSYIRSYNPPTIELKASMIPHPACFIRANVYRKYGLFNTCFKMAADYELMLRLYTRNVKFVHIDTILANYRNDGASVKAEVLSMNEANQIKRTYNIGLGKRTILKNKLKSIIIHRLFHR